MQCVKCHAELKPESRFCGKCGSDVASAIMERNIQTLQNDGYRKEPRVPCPSCQRSMTLVKTETRQGVAKRSAIESSPLIAKSLIDLVFVFVFDLLANIFREIFFPPKKLIVETDSFTCSFCGHKWTSNERTQQAK